MLQAEGHIGTCQAGSRKQQQLCNCTCEITVLVRRTSGTPWKRPAGVALQQGPSRPKSSGGVNAPAIPVGHVALAGGPLVVQAGQLAGPPFRGLPFAGAA